MKQVIYISLTGLILGLFSCNDEEISSPLTTNTTIDTRFMNSDSISVLNELISELGTDITELTRLVEAAQSEIDALNIRINLEPENDSLEIWQETVAKLTATKEANETTLSSRQSQNTSFSNKRDSLNQGYSTLKSVTNLLTGESIELDTLLTTYRLPLDFNSTEAMYLIQVDDEMNQITLTYELEEVISINGRVTLTINNLMVTQNEFNDLTINDEEIYIFHF